MIEYSKNHRKLNSVGPAKVKGDSNKDTATKIASCHGWGFGNKTHPIPNDLLNEVCKIQIDWPTQTKCVHLSNASFIIGNSFLSFRFIPVLWHFKNVMKHYKLKKKHDSRKTL